EQAAAEQAAAEQAAAEQAAAEQAAVEQAAAEQAEAEQAEAEQAQLAAEDALAEQAVADELPVEEFVEDSLQTTASESGEGDMLAQDIEALIDDPEIELPALEDSAQVAPAKDVEHAAEGPSEAELAEQALLAAMAEDNGDDFVAPQAVDAPSDSEDLNAAEQALAELEAAINNDDGDDFDVPPPEETAPEPAKPTSRFSDAYFKLSEQAIGISLTTEFDRVELPEQAVLGIFVADENGVPMVGQVMRSDMRNGGTHASKIRGLKPGMEVGLFLIVDGELTKAGLKNGDKVGFAGTDHASRFNTLLSLDDPNIGYTNTMLSEADVMKIDTVDGGIRWVCEGIGFLPRVLEMKLHFRELAA
ncbi:MAG: hypothetical protein HWE20_09870, partial [Gammaproteobacteria bacterium]|nr:hypothetical protein [Gammaproteobacteria bacterium]